MRRYKQPGFTLVELLIAITIIGILLAIGLPSFQQTIDKSRLVGAADNLLAEMRYAQTEATKRNVPITVEFTESPNWSYKLCTSKPCTSTTIIKTTQGSDYRGTSTLVSMTEKSFIFDPKRGTLDLDPDPPLTSATTLVTITSALGAKLGLEVDPLSRMRLCTSTGVGGYPTCP